MPRKNDDTTKPQARRTSRPKPAKRGEFERGENPNVQPAEKNLPPNFSRQDNPNQTKDY